MKKKEIGYVFVLSLLVLFILAVLEPKITGLAINILEDYPLNLYAVLAFIFAFSTVVSGIAYHQSLDIIEAKRDKSLKKLDGYIQDCLSQGRKEYSIRQELLAYGWHEDYIENSFSFIRNDKNVIDFHNYSKYINK